MTDKIKDRFLAASFVLGTFFVAILAFGADAIVEPTTPSDAIGFLGPILEAFKSKNWAAFAALLIMILVYGVRQLGLPFLKDKPALLALISQLVGCVAAISVALYSGTPVWSAVLGGMFISAAASGFWSSLFKFILPKPKSEVESGK